MKIRQIWEVQKSQELKFLNLLEKKTRQNTDEITVFLKRLGRFRRIWRSFRVRRFGKEVWNFTIGRSTNSRRLSSLLSTKIK